MVDARRCLAWLLQATGDFPRELRVALGDRIYGCDDCQEVCPQNPGPPERDDGDTDGTWVSIVELLTAGDADLLARYGRWYIAARDPRYLRRNALVVLGNIGRPDDPVVEQLLSRYLDHDDGMLRSHAAWAARRLGRDDLLEARSGDPTVADELDRPPPVGAQRR